MIPLPEKKYDIIYADPPWDHGGRWWRKGTNGKVVEKSVRDHYPVMSFKELKALPVIDVAGDNSLLFLWVISSKFLECVDVAKSWGFKYITVVFVWHKDSHFVLGSYTHGECELCLICRRGKIPQPRGSRKERQFIMAKRGKHSEKPVEARKRIERMFPTQSKIELFARERVEGWDVWGNEV